MTSAHIAQRVAEARFTPVRMREGYDMREVDDLLDQIVAVAGAPEAVAALVASARFTRVRLREGYDMAEVDEFLASLVGRREPGASTSPDSDTVRRSSDGGITETRTWWSRVFGTKGR